MIYFMLKIVSNHDLVSVEQSLKISLNLSFVNNPYVQMNDEI